ncbi:MAG: hypothetical protein J7J06_02245 [Methanosarcinales archaeon]|nr:hypothetical protein [Methanosarcinales archaeon]
MDGRFGKYQLLCEFIQCYRTKHEFFGKEFTTVILYSDTSYRKQMESYEKRKAKMLEKLADLQRRLGSNKGKKRNLRLSITRLVDELDGIRLALVQKKTVRNVMMMVEEMGVKQARLFSLLDLGKFMVC